MSLADVKEKLLYFFFRQLGRNQGCPFKLLAPLVLPTHDKKAETVTVDKRNRFQLFVFEKRPAATHLKHDSLFVQVNA
jgi:hypothetical protein